MLLDGGIGGHFTAGAEYLCAGVSGAELTSFQAVVKGRASLAFLLSFRNKSSRMYRLGEHGF